ncbi:hypothetical protein [Rufibacter immobilis]|uniref:hypothetical protein n=1 Tax=Rufibacter immobilis TaxID=1348778 RepID=UPI0035EE21B2
MVVGENTNNGEEVKSRRFGKKGNGNKLQGIATESRRWISGCKHPPAPSKGESVLAKAVCLAAGENFNNDPTAGTPAMAADNFLETKKSKSV